MPYKFSYCRIVPLPDYQVSFQIGGVERTRWHFGRLYPRPFFYPIVGPSGSSLTRMGHPGAANHDHHRSVWFAHAKVLGIDFWSDRTDARIRQKHWLSYKDGDDEAVMAVLLGWYDGHDPQELLQQELVVAVRPGLHAETFLEVQSTFLPKADSLEFGKTNFGFLAVRVAKEISEHFGGGRLTNSAGAVHESNIFGKQAKWMDYSGPVESGATEGITYFDHPDNPNYPANWHVREDGWMGASFCMNKSVITNRKNPLQLRYMLHVHQGAVNSKRAEEAFADFASRPPYQLVIAAVKHQQYEVRRRTNQAN